MYRFIFVSMICMSFFCPSVLADQIVLKNGDRFTGKIVKKDGDKIVIETESAGTIAILWAAVDQIMTDEALNIKLTDGQVINGIVKTNSNAELTIETRDAREIQVEKANVEIVRNVAEQRKFEAEQTRLLNPGLLELWTGSADVGFSLTSGNSSTKALTVGAKAERETRRDKIGLYARAIQASNSNSGIAVTTAQAVLLGGRYEYNLSPKTFVFGTADFEYDKPQQLNLRSVFGGGFGYRAIRSERTSFDVYGGATYNRESYSDGTRRNSAEGLIGETLKFKLTKSTNLEQRFAVYPNLSNFGEFRSVADASFVTALNDRLRWHVTIGNRFNSNPAVGSEKNDFLFTTGLRATFGRK